MTLYIAHLTDFPGQEFNCLRLNYIYILSVSRTALAALADMTMLGALRRIAGLIQ